MNESTVVSGKELGKALVAFQKQILADFAPLWGMNAELVLVHPGKQPPANAWQLVILDNADQADALGYHDLTASDLPLMKVFALTAANDGVSWTSVASHEILEALADPYIDSTVFVESGTSGGRLWPMEICDPVQGDVYNIGSVEVSDFVTPAWFMTAAPATATFDFLKLTSHAFDIRPNGYMQFYDVQGTGWGQINRDREPGLGN